VNDAAGIPPNCTAVAVPTLTPVIVTVVPPALGPRDGETLRITGPGPSVVAVTVGDCAVSADPLSDVMA
jgi:hypothetical protein